MNTWQPFRANNLNLILSTFCVHGILIYFDRLKTILPHLASELQNLDINEHKKTEFLHAYFWSKNHWYRYVTNSSQHWCWDFEAVKQDEAKQF